MATGTDEPLSARYPRMDLEKAATDAEFTAVGMQDGEPMVVFKAKPGMLQRLPQFEAVDFLIRTNGDMYVGNKHWMLAGSAASSQRGGGNALSAGEMIRVADSIWFNLASGTYGPGAEQAGIVVQTLKALGMAGVFKGVLSSLPQRKG